MSLCPICHGAITPGEAFCASCGKPLQGQPPTARRPAPPPREPERVGDRWERTAHESNLRSGRNAILAVSILQAIGAIVFYFVLKSQGASDEDAMAVLLVNAVLSVIFFGLWIWAKTSPFAAAVTALVIFVTVHVVNAVLEPESIVKGIIVKVIVIFCLVKAVNSGIAHRRLQERRG